ncbi:bifunctional 4-hydroxy-2-oxoglutarate aldolase/2-dehydro-3-deoxy-phosphogluconate aldolase [Membranicola marinus]|uniref:Bifunctional 4-hydroxy-2-oxoglutarate aldolase/2-dehydro-3-deoxy-phosphogluconate aldolase n=1 Tax=Membranihabitans marinus TaxID=1227546 RepID=A0A953L8W6_9BACT|nr:bifunctional 4-hydroxy-2-oxoglutarate aldolase/2-dehydro-3-deoxy-phosphogluconate aldolase [Membranihabitans marinus]MBY5960252.1 bifunctional 4-hydroxy-2-oxoglutarate aldolase/2-dehydro-3-deoxy-phosphogluconate aldolase [Membranihabitans marinus]
MKSGNFVWDKFNEMPIIGIMRNINPDSLPYILNAFHNAGLSTIEITLNSINAKGQMQSALSTYGSQLNVGMGTIRNIQELEMALNYGAQFIVTPNVNANVISRCKKIGVPIFAGALTPTEICNARSLGAAMVKLYPASVMGPDYLKSLKGPLDQVPLIATGGVDKNNMSDFISAGATGLGIGSTLFKQELIDRKDWSKLETHMKGYVRIFNTCTT